jgi:hypothetical protein
LQRNYTLEDIFSNKNGGSKMAGPFDVGDRVRLTAHDDLFSYHPVGSEGTVKKILHATRTAAVHFDADAKQNVFCPVRYGCLEKIGGGRTK